MPKEKVRLHVCRGSFHGPHEADIPLRDVTGIIFRVDAGSFSIEASNPRHEHEWNVFEEVKLPEGATLVPGVVGHCTDFIEHPDRVAGRLVRYANLVGRENVLGGTDCGLGPGIRRSPGPSPNRSPRARAARASGCGRGVEARPDPTHQIKKPGFPGFFPTPARFQAGRMLVACLPLGPVATSNVTFWFSLRVLKPLP